MHARQSADYHRGGESQSNSRKNRVDFRQSKAFLNMQRNDTPVAEKILSSQGKTNLLSSTILFNYEQSLAVAHRTGNHAE